MSAAARPGSAPLAGRLEQTVIASRALAANPLGDSPRRPLWAYLPPGYDADSASRYPTIYVLQGLTGQVEMWANRSAFRPSFLELADELFASGGAAPCILVLVDAWTSLGGSQFLDSPATGRYHTYLCDEVVPFVDARWRTLAGAAHRGIAGHSSGGYGAMVTPMLRPDIWGGLATHAGDALFEVCHMPEFPGVARALRDHYGGAFDRFWSDFRDRPAFSRPDDAALLNAWCMAACYSADADGTVRLPFDPATGALVDDVWARWLAHDPVRMAARHVDALRGLRAIYVDAGTRDEYYLDLGAEAFRRALAEAGVADVAFELFDGRHGGMEYRYPRGVAHLAERLAPPL